MTDKTVPRSLTDEEKAWEPSQERIDKTIALLKQTPGDGGSLWDEFKSVEAKVGNLWNATGKKIDVKIDEINPDIADNRSNTANLLFRLRELARKEAGL